MTKKISLADIEKHLIRNSTTKCNSWHLSTLFDELQIPYISGSIDSVYRDDIDIECYWFNKNYVNMEDYGIVGCIGVRAYFFRDKLVAVSAKYEDHEVFFWIQGRFEGVIDYLNTLPIVDRSYISKLPITADIDLFYNVLDGREVCDDMDPSPFENAYYEGEKVDIGFLQQDTTKKSSIPRAEITTKSGRSLTVPFKDLEFLSNVTPLEEW